MGLVPYQFSFAKWDCVKAPGLNDRKWVHIDNIDPLTIVQSRELSRGPTWQNKVDRVLATSDKLQVSKITIERQEDHPDPKNAKLASAICQYLRFDVTSVKILRSYTIHKSLSPDEIHEITCDLLIDPVIEKPCSDQAYQGYDWCIEVSFKPGVTDNAGKTAQITIEDYLDLPFEDDEFVSSSTHTLLQGSLNREQVRIIAQEMLANPLIESIQIHHLPYSLPGVQIIDLNIDDQELVLMSQRMQLALNLKEMKTIQQYYLDADVRKKREEFKLPPQPTDVELEALAQTWSEHCKHKIFQAKIHYLEDGVTQTIDSVFKSYIMKATDDLQDECPWLVSVFSDNAGIIRFTDHYNLAFKVETHNSPSALDPYGGALTGILGVNRDIMGAGIGARLVANTNILCFAPPNYDKPIPERLLSPKRVFEGVRLGIEHGGNKSGVPTVNGAIIFDDCYLGKPLVYCGSVGIMPAEINGHPSHVKEILPGDMIVIAGGRTGKDGIHGATFSSEELHADSPSSAVQIGDPFTQKKLHDFLIEARDLSLYRTVTDNGAGGFSSSVGELAELSGGCEIHLDKAHLKQTDCLPWEILVSESQERMTLAVSSENYSQLCQLAKVHEIELCHLGTFTDSGLFHVLDQGSTVACLDLNFLHNGLPQLELDAEWITPTEKPLSIPPYEPQKILHQLLSRYDICSKESVIRQYDHEVQGGSTLKPLVGIDDDGPSDASVTRPLEVMNEQVGFVVANGICPRYSVIDGYHMAANAIDEAFRNCVAVGADPSTIAILDNFCWPDPIYDEQKTPDGKLKLAHLVRANQALYDLSTIYKSPIISGKDSMKNDYKIGKTKISINPTLLISALGKVPDVMKVVSMDFKQTGDLIYILGTTKDELGCSEFSALLGLKGGFVPKVEPQQAIQYYHAFYKAIEQELVASCHDCSEGGLAVALSESAFAGGYGVLIELQQVPTNENLSETALLFSESASRLLISVAPEHSESFERILGRAPFAKIGVVTSDNNVTIKGLNENTLIQEDIAKLKASWQKTLGGES
ncbi:MAG: Phosphoribosylformylglycinamidine synthase subunit PurL [Chlamydiae bacterium]|nr:Phosphoribosylformylglycinamidine synthase subunit PurL [Chlamydiota bacterium]